MRTQRLTIALLVAAAFVLVPDALDADDGGVRALDASATDREHDFKPLAVTAVDIDPTSLSAGDSVLRIELDGESGVSFDRVVVTTSGNVAVDQTSFPFDGAAASSNELVEATVEVGVASLTGDGEVTATLFATAVDGSTTSISDTVWVSSVRGIPVVSGVGAQDLALRVADLGVALGTTTVNEAESARDDALGGTDAEIVLSAPAAGPCADVCVNGTVSWTDAAGDTHPVRRATVEIREADGDRDVLIESVATNDDGEFSALIDAVDGGGGARDVFARVVAEGPGFRFVRSNAQPQFIQSQVVTDVEPGSTVSIPFVANNVDDNNTVFSLHNAMVIAVEYLETVRQSPLPPVDIVFPASGTFYSLGRVNMLKLDRWDWDVMLHEYGHFVAAQLGIERNPGGSHSGSQNLSDTPGRNKDQGVRLAWGEGWPSFFAVSALVEMDAASLGIANIGDTKYQDTEDAVILIDLEVGRALGEDNEVTVMSALWDLYDAASDDLDSTTIGDQRVWTTLDDADPHTLSEAYAAFAPNGGAAFDNINCVFTQMNVAPGLAPVPEVDDDPPTFTWRHGNGGLNGRNDRFVVDIRDGDGVVVHVSGPLSSTSYTVPAAMWSEIVATTEGELDVAVVGVETNTPTTGPYRSCARTMTRDGTSVPVDPDVSPVITTVTPARFVDTRSTGRTVDGRYVADGRRGAGATYEIDFAGRGQVPVDARAVVVNVTAVRPDGTGFVTGFDCAPPRPSTSSLNFVRGINTGNEIVLGLSADGEACLYTSNAADVTVDVTGYIADDSGLVMRTPARLMETRQSGQTTIDGLHEGGGPVAGGGKVVLAVAGRGGVPVGAVAAVLNVTAIGSSESGFVTVHPCLGEVPRASSLNYVAGVNRANELISPLDASGQLCLFTAATTHLTVDVVGYLKPDHAFDELEPSRLLDTRPSGRTVDGLAKATGRLEAGTQVRLQVAGRGVSGHARSVVVNITAVDPEGVGFLTVHPCGSAPPGASSLNYTTRVTGSNEIVARLDAGGGVCIFTSSASHVLVDVTAVVR